MDLRVRDLRLAGPSNERFAVLDAHRQSIIRNHTPGPELVTRSRTTKPTLPFDTMAGDHAYQLARTNGRLLYGFGHGSSFLSIPFVALMDLVGISPATAIADSILAGELIDPEDSCRASDRRRWSSYSSAQRRWFWSCAMERDRRDWRRAWELRCGAPRRAGCGRIRGK